MTKKIAAIMCPGPSLDRSCPTAGTLECFDVIIAVNRALLHPAVRVAAHWHACGDWDTLRAIDCRPRTGICTTIDSARVTRQGPHRHTYDGLAWIVWESLRVAPGFSTIAALGLAKHLGMDNALLFGDDKQGKLDWDGELAGRNRADDRWKRERELQAAAITKLEITVQYAKERTPV